MRKFLKQCDQSTNAGYTAIENSISNSTDNFNNYNKNSSNNNKLPQIGDMLHFSNKHKKTMKELIHVSILKEQISSLKEELAKKDEEIVELKKIEILQILQDYKITLLKTLMN